MAVHFKTIISKLFFIAGCIYSAIYLLSCCTPYISPEHLSALTFLALGFPFLFAGMLVWLLLVLLFYRKSILIFILIILLGSENIFSVFAINIPKEFVQEKKENSLRVLSWNVQEFVDSQIANDTPRSIRRTIMAFIQQADADIVCIQDFQEHTSKDFFSCLNDITNKSNYPYHYFSIDHELSLYYAFIQYGTVIFSRYPIIDSGRMAYPVQDVVESLAFADILKGKDTIRIFNTHLKSMYIKANTEDSTLNVDFIGKDIAFLKKNTSKYSRLQHYDTIHIAQAKFVKEQLNKSKYPFIFCADLNSVPSSYVYHTVQEGLKDVFTTKSFGLGATYYDISPTLRIDVILTSQHFKPLQYYSPAIKASDHYPVVADIQLK
ncbi:MAG: endonuclease/exonuclease/phosphatase family protein [Chitinophagaceae bacterium]|nr:endonuclease/exonuclease/phosphatase family protein [Chitinophagaceae bacterium]MCW5905523.1 endonuclease/exonuclease/phosphatase family protein [Chitinophagaceae bacterium]